MYRRTRKRSSEFAARRIRVLNLVTSTKKGKGVPIGAPFSFLIAVAFSMLAAKRRKFAFTARRSASSLARRRACESRSEAELPCHPRAISPPPTPVRLKRADTESNPYRLFGSIRVFCKRTTSFMFWGHYSSSSDPSAPFTVAGTAFFL